ncbi:hypothetical protein Tco_0932060 [Tanacetum coccineum]
MVFHNEDGNPARANIKQALGYLKDGDGDGNSQHLRYQEEVGSRELASTDVVLETTEKIEIICERLKATQDRWKSYADNRRRPIEFNVGHFVMLKVSPWKGVFRFKNKGKLSSRFIGPFKILKKCSADESSVITLDDIETDLELTSREEPVTILGMKSRQLSNKVISLVKVQRKNHKGTSIRWEPEEKMRIRFEWSRQGILQILQSFVSEMNPDSVDKNDPNDVQLQDEDIMYDIASSVEVNLVYLLIFNSLVSLYLLAST